MKLKNDKKCSRCEKILDLNNFGVSNKAKDGKQNYCLSCSREYSRLKRIANPPKEVTPGDTELEILRTENKRWKTRFRKILNLYLNDMVIS